MKKVSTKSNFLFKTKADTLKQLVKLVEQSKIEKIYVFTVEEWQSSQTTILKYISSNFNKKIIVRSSAVGEDSAISSEAGSYESILNVNTSSKKEITNAINSVISSYEIKNNNNNNNKILIQNQTLNVVVSGVIFTRTPDIGSPYFVINFEEGNITTGVTKGSINNTVKIFRKINPKIIPEKWTRLIISVKEIEKIVDSDKLDIEFGITKNDQVVLFQVRPLTSIREKSKNIPDHDISKIVLNSKKQFKKLNKPHHILGNKTVFSDMADWNPAEIIGNNPNQLDYSLYDFLIMKNSWSIGRTVLGYQDVKSYRLMRNFGNKPYVDTRGSFNSLIPDNINQKLKKKLVDFYLKKLINSPHLHDKVEFEILFTCYDFTLPDRLNELKKYGFSKFELIQIKRELLKLTIEIIEKFPKISSNCLSLINKMSDNRKKIKSNLQHSSTTKNLVVSVEQLLNDCKKFGAIPFSTMARIAFIGSIMLKSLQKQGYLENSFVENFMNSISSPLSEIQDDMNAVINKKLSKKQFLKKYGHLRPGTYDITASRYDIQKKFFGNVQEGTTYKPIIAIFATTILMALSTAWALGELSIVRVIELFIAFSMCGLAIQKLRDLEAFSLQFLNYDILAQKWVKYSYVYPFVEMLAGVAMISGFLTILSAPAAIVIATINGYSVFKAVYIDKRELKCACVGGNSNVPLGFISLTENIMMAGMGFWMLYHLI